MSMRRALLAALAGLFLTGCETYYTLAPTVREANARAEAAEALNTLCQGGDRDACVALFDKGVRVEDRREE